MSAVTTTVAMLSWSLKLQQWSPRLQPTASLSSILFLFPKTWSDVGLKGKQCHAIWNDWLLNFELCCHSYPQWQWHHHMRWPIVFGLGWLFPKLEFVLFILLLNVIFCPFDYKPLSQHIVSNLDNLCCHCHLFHNCLISCHVRLVSLAWTLVFGSFVLPNLVELVKQDLRSADKGSTIGWVLGCFAWLWESWTVNKHIQMCTKLNLTILDNKDEFVIIWQWGDFHQTELFASKCSTAAELIIDGQLAKTVAKAFFQSNIDDTFTLTFTKCPNKVKRVSVKALNPLPVLYLLDTPEEFVFCFLSKRENVNASFGAHWFCELVQWAMLNGACFATISTLVCLLDCVQLGFHLFDQHEDNNGSHCMSSFLLVCVCMPASIEQPVILIVHFLLDQWDAKGCDRSDSNIDVLRFSDNTNQQFSKPVALQSLIFPPVFKELFEIQLRCPLLCLRIMHNCYECFL